MKEKQLIINGRTESVLYAGSGLGEFARKISGMPSSSIHVIADRNAIAPTESILPDFFKKISGGLPPICLEADERNKTLAEAERICRELEKRGADRDSLLVVAGGGITTDLAGFVASVYRRGVKAVFIPTTLLAQTDAAIGGKNGVNLGGHKNMIGTIRQPAAVYLCEDYIREMPPGLLMDGLSEMLKIFMITSPSDYEKVCGIFSDGFFPVKSDTGHFFELVYSAAKAKMDIVAEDQFEHGRRELLNLGHTFAHAVESVTGGAVSHGRAVAEGMLLAAKAGVVMGATSPDFLDKIENDFEKCGITGTKIEYGRPSDLLPHMLVDKKKHADGIHLIVPKALGDVAGVSVNKNGLEKILSLI